MAQEFDSYANFHKKQQDREEINISIFVTSFFYILKNSLMILEKITDFTPHFI